MATITPEQRQEVEKSGDEPVRFEDPVTHQIYVMAKEEVYKRLLKTAEFDQSDESFFEVTEYRDIP